MQRFPLLSLILIAWFAPGTCAAAEAIKADVCVYGATPGGIAAAISAAKSGHSVLLIEPTDRIGGLVTSGLSHTDFHSFESLSGAYLDFAHRVEAYYAKKYGQTSQQVKDSFRGTFAEPHVNLIVFEEMIAQWPKLELKKQTVLNSVTVLYFGSGPKRVSSASFHSAANRAMDVEANVYIDATYEGDLMAKARVPFHVGREAQHEYGESLAPQQADEQLQAYNFRFIMTRRESNRVKPQPPTGYDRKDFVGVLDALDSGKIKEVFGYPKDCIFKAQTPPLPNGKYDINDVSHSLVRLSLPGKNLAWPNGSAEDRAKVFAEHLRDQVGLLYFLQNDEAVPERFRNEAVQWGWCRDEFPETQHLPPQLYVREARRMIGQYVFTQQDSNHADGDARAKLHRDSIAMGDYGNNCHGTAHEGPRFGGRHTGDFYHPVPPYQIPYGVIVPETIDNLLVCGAVSSTHVGFCALRLEPIWMSLGQAAGHAAAIAIQNSTTVQDVDVASLQKRLHSEGSATVYVSDVLPGAPEFAAVQWWGTRGGLHGLEPMPSKPGQRGKVIHGQYYEASPGHAAKLDQGLDDNLRRRWQKLAPLEDAQKPATRRDWIIEAHRVSTLATSE